MLNGKKTLLFVANRDHVSKASIATLLHELSARNFDPVALQVMGGESALTVVNLDGLVPEERENIRELVKKHTDVELP